MSTSVLRFGQLVIGPPGSGKSTYCKAMKEFLTALGRKVVIVNLDPANEALPYECSVDVSELITLQDVMERLHLGPNGSLIYCMEYLEKNTEWLKTRLEAFKEQQHYFLFDCPGQVELYTHHCSVRNVAQQLEKWKFKVSRHLHQPNLNIGRKMLLTIRLHWLDKVELWGGGGGIKFPRMFYPPPPPPPIYFQGVGCRKFVTCSSSGPSYFLCCSW